MDWDHHREYTINGIIEISREEASSDRSFRLFSTLAEMSFDRTLYDNASALDVYNNIINNPIKYPSLRDAAIHCMKNDRLVGRAGSG